MGAGEQRAPLEIGMDMRGDRVVGGRAGGGRDVDDEARQVVVAGLGEMDLVG